MSAERDLSERHAPREFTRGPFMILPHPRAIDVVAFRPTPCMTSIVSDLLSVKHRRHRRRTVVLLTLSVLNLHLTTQHPHPVNVKIQSNGLRRPNALPGGWPQTMSPLNPEPSLVPPDIDPIRTEAVAGGAAEPGVR
jgi:hypothetical protein